MTDTHTRSIINYLFLLRSLTTHARAQFENFQQQIDHLKSKINTTITNLKSPSSPDMFPSSPSPSPSLPLPLPLPEPVSFELTCQYVFKKGTRKGQMCNQPSTIRFLSDQQFARCRQHPLTDQEQESMNKKWSTQSSQSTQHLAPQPTAQHHHPSHKPTHHFEEQIETLIKEQKQALDLFTTHAGRHYKALFKLHPLFAETWLKIEQQTQHTCQQFNHIFVQLLAAKCQTLQEEVTIAEGNKTVCPSSRTECSHPEVSGDISSLMIGGRKDPVSSEGLNPSNEQVIDSGNEN